MSNINFQGIKNFKGLKNALHSVSEIHSYSLDLGFALGLLKQCNSRSRVSFHVDGAGYRPAKLSADEWKEIADSQRFHLNPRYKKGGVFHSKAWIFKNSLLLGSANLSIREARENLNFWCWLPRFTSGKLPCNKSFTVFWDLNKQKPIIKKDSLLNAINGALAGIKMTTMVVVSPQPPSKNVLSALRANLADKGDCLFFLSTESHGLSSLPNRKNWKVKNFIPFDRSNGLHGKTFYGEWNTKGKPGAIIYVGSANFTKAAYTGKNIETGILIKAEGSRQVKILRQSLSSLLGKSGTVSKDEKAQATERFDGRWEQIAPPDKRQNFEGELLLRKGDIALSEFMNGLWAKGNCLHFPAIYGGKEISKAELKLGKYIPRHWEKPAKHIFAGVIWSPDTRLKLVLKRGKTVTIYLPPLEGLMGGQDGDSEFINLILNHTAKADSGNGNGVKNTRENLGNLCIYSDPRVIVPWQTFAAQNKTHLFDDKEELKTVLETIRAILEEPKDKKINHINQKLENLAFCIESLIEGGS